MAYNELRRLLPLLDIAYLADRKNAPYGTKEKEELIRLVNEDISRLLSLGCRRILIACCTASTVYEYLPQQYKRITTPIIQPTVSELLRPRRSSEAVCNVTVIATEATVKSGAFSKGYLRAIKASEASKSDNYNWHFNEISAQRLVRLVEDGCRDHRLSWDAKIYLDELCGKIERLRPSALILGCTHFAHLSSEIADRLPGVRLLSPAKLGAREIYKAITENKEAVAENGRCLYL